mmetsp:Transcript_75838/g.209266  ORF Transcript_75838/g.209266 Transcript_75838/m.209266 type:complete len:81 (-) Transcript_75838:165-407(-)
MVGCLPDVDECIQNCQANIEMLKAIDAASHGTDAIMTTPLRELLPELYGHTPDMPEPPLSFGGAASTGYTSSGSYRELEA